MKTLLYIITFVLMVSCTNIKPNEDKPNVIVLLVDDAGYADFGFAGCEDLKTPNIDKLATNGIRFTDAHVTASVCGPSRAGLMIGRYQQRIGFECNPSDDTMGIDLNEVTIANAMKKAGYVTAAFGKWHLGANEPYKPNNRGFDYFWGFLSGGRSYFPNKSQDKPGHTHSVRENDEFTTFEGYITDRLGDKAVEFIDRNKEKPFFMYWAPNAVHTPLEATDEDLAMFEGHPRQLLAAMTWALDRAVGSIINKLETEGLLDNTLIFFLSDNGGAHNNQSCNAPLKGFKGNKYEGGHRVPFLVHWPKKLQGNRTYDGLSSSLDIYATSIAVAGVEQDNLDGVNLIPYLTGEKEGEPHDQLFWRKDKMAAARVGDYKMIRVDGLGVRLYNLDNNLQETVDLSGNEKNILDSVNTQMQLWESKLIQPLWTEGKEWDTITFMIHEDYFNNNQVRVKNPGQLKEWRKTNKQ
ncbi:sulfatase-like hydrolase/transferase [Draconibacterium orientale]|uniref:sulfatase-like hydrolase/transferase n=1 Tax=Draconibacterium orientale TaxID=1168034 RepID=UPI002ABD7D54|nr:sulfatase-like hydrolase/transferase [Draconibacterium orientale]